MSEKKDSAAGKKKKLDLRYRSSDDPHDPNAKRFDFFLIDTGWNEKMSAAVKSRLIPLMNIEKKEAIYVLSCEQSLEIIKSNPHLIGHDPIILVYDHYAHPDRKKCGYRGFRLNLGLMKNAEQAVARLQEFLRFVAINREATHLQTKVRKELYREGIDGMIKILREASTELI